MAAEEFARDGLGWRARLLSQKLSEWLELQSTDIPVPPVPKWRGSEWFDNLGRVIFWILFVALIAWGLWQLWKLLRPYLRDHGRVSVSDRPPTDIVDLPASLWMQRAGSAALRGNYRQGIFCLYRATLQQLDSNGIIYQESSRTDGEYLQLLRGLPHARAYRTLFVAHQQLCFSRAEADSELYNRCLQAFQELS
ncbi:hypothetical protein KR51_00004380 [Rubidibacter lacunae KORDI 51-2]|uniref:Protein-glutamine gamma-glutamyltransferase-like C-terminal domain-containing protein n=1 Tax=Rubidibacter lacunae KORDI 51-2 TaxID=582515 RepID=U5DT06_9CHRO|nr:DUF4129 domain-containing protein [Rubidibacter lacunae]ERN42820.1 hypothetical protein KR51_00004380 [Rubidibacter lacunae KORDI 51-2]